MQKAIDRYLITGLLVYAASAASLIFRFELAPGDLLIVALILGAGFTSVALLLTAKLPLPLQRPPFKNEVYFLFLLIVWIGVYISVGSQYINKIIPHLWTKSERISSVVSIARKLFVFVVIPFLLYAAKGFTWKDFGLASPPVKLWQRTSIALLLAFAVIISLFQLYLSHGGKILRSEHYSAGRLMIAVPLCLSVLVLEVGLVEEFFFRGLLQSRLSALLKSPTGGIVLSAIIFGLVHAPGLYLRGAEGEGVEGQLPLLFWAAYTIANMSLAGIFLGVIYNKTKNLWLVMIVHAMVDLIPNLKDFIQTWSL